MIDKSDALFMARRVMQRNLERAQDLQSVCDNDLVRSIMLESAAWLTDFGADRDKGISDYLKKRGETEAAELWDTMTPPISELSPQPTGRTIVCPECDGTGKLDEVEWVKK